MADTAVIKKRDPLFPTTTTTPAPAVDPNAAAATGPLVGPNAVQPAATQAPPATPTQPQPTGLFHWLSSLLPSTTPTPPGGFNPATPTQLAHGLPVISDFDPAPQPQTPPPAAQPADGGYWTPRIAQSVLGGVRSGLSLPGDVAKGLTVPSDPNFAGRTADMANLANLGTLGERPWQAVKRWTPSDAVAATMQAEEAAKTQLSDIKIPSKDLGFRVAGQENPSALDVQGYRDWLKGQGVQDVGFPPSATSGANYVGPTHAYSEDTAGFRQWLKNEAVRRAAQPSPTTNLPTAPQRMMESIDKALAPGTPAGTAAQQAQLAAQQAQNAQTLQRWGTTQGLPGVNVQAEAAEAMKSYPAGSPQSEALKAIAAAKAKEGRLSGFVRATLPTVSTGAGEYVSNAFGFHGGAMAGAALGQGLSSAFERLLGSKNVAPVVQQQIARAYGPLAGQPVETGSALARALMTLSNAARPP